MALKSLYIKKKYNQRSCQDHCSFLTEAQIGTGVKLLRVRTLEEMWSWGERKPCLKANKNIMQTTCEDLNFLGVAFIK